MAFLDNFISENLIRMEASFEDYKNHDYIAHLSETENSAVLKAYPLEHFTWMKGERDYDTLYIDREFEFYNAEIDNSKNIVEENKTKRESVLAFEFHEFKESLYWIRKNSELEKTIKEFLAKQEDL